MAKLICQNPDCGREFEVGKNAKRTMFCSDPVCQAFKRKRQLNMMKEATKRARAKAKKANQDKPKTIPKSNKPIRYCNYCGKPLPPHRRFNHKRCAEAIEKQGRCDDGWGFLPFVDEDMEMVSVG